MRTFINRLKLCSSATFSITYLFMVKLTYWSSDEKQHINHLHVFLTSSLLKITNLRVKLLFAVEVLWLDHAKPVFLYRLCIQKLVNVVFSEVYVSTITNSWGQNIKYKTHITLYFYLRWWVNLFSSIWLCLFLFG